MHGRMFARRFIARSAIGNAGGGAPPSRSRLPSRSRGVLVVTTGLLSGAGFVFAPTVTGASPPGWANPSSSNSALGAFGQGSPSAAPDQSASSSSTTTTVSPAVTALSPTSVTAGGGATVTITGTAFTGATAVDFGPNASSNFTVQADTSITAVAPVGANTVAVRVVTPGGTSALVKADRLTYAPTGQLPVTVTGSSLEVGGVPTTFTGVNAYELATDYGVNGGCGDMSSPAQLASLFSTLAPDSIVRFDAFQGSMATNYYTGQLDWAPIDQIFSLAAQYDVYLIPVITGQAAGCDGGHWQDPTWYKGGYKSVFNTTANSDGLGLDPLSYWQFMQDLVSRYSASPALAMWEPISEPDPATCPAADQPSNCAGNATCPSESTATSALQTFYTNVGEEFTRWTRAVSSRTARSTEDSAVPPTVTSRRWHRAPGLTSSAFTTTRISCPGAAMTGAGSMPGWLKRPHSECRLSQARWVLWPATPVIPPAKRWRSERPISSRRRQRNSRRVSVPSWCGAGIRLPWVRVATTPAPATPS